MRDRKIRATAAAIILVVKFIIFWSIIVIALYTYKTYSLNRLAYELTVNLNKQVQSNLITDDYQHTETIKFKDAKEHEEWHNYDDREVNE
jgi:hypothetical protein